MQKEIRFVVLIHLIFFKHSYFLCYNLLQANHWWTQVRDPGEFPVMHNITLLLEVIFYCFFFFLYKQNFFFST